MGEGHLVSPRRRRKKQAFLISQSLFDFLRCSICVELPSFMTIHSESSSSPDALALFKLSRIDMIIWWSDVQVFTLTDIDLDGFVVGKG